MQTNSPMDEAEKASRTIQKTLMTALLFEGFWDRWIAHGIDRSEAAALRPKLTDLKSWIAVLSEQAEVYESLAETYLAKGSLPEAERAYRTAGLYLNLVQWIYPDADLNKREWHRRSLRLFKSADRISNLAIRYATVEVDGRPCFGRIRYAAQPQGCVIMIIPIDSCKEELVAYETDFTEKGFTTISFDGPGQGETYVENAFRATRERWERFINQIIDETVRRFPDQPIALFGTSSGASWAIHASGHPSVQRAVAVSPACTQDVKMPDYFMERMAFALERDTDPLLPETGDYGSCSPILLFHGQKDVMVRDEDIQALYRMLPAGTRLVEYADEGHCCNFKLEEIRRISADWILGGER